MIRALYVHIPFCSSKCPYCDFMSVEGTHLKGVYLRALEREMELYRELPAKIRSVYFGGGTPSLLDPKEIERLISRVYEIFPVEKEVEITVECNPEDYKKEDYERLLDAGVNRVSLGVQSFSEKGLRALGRKHSREEVLRALERVLGTGFRSVNVDLIWGYPSQGEEELLFELEELSRFGVSHVSAYLLTLYPETKMGEMALSGKISPPDEERIARLHELLSEGLRALGFERYEVSNWAKRGHECVHNLTYWRMEEFLGFGASAWGLVGRVRYMNERNISAYIELVSLGKKPAKVKEKLSQKEFLKEKLMLGLRTREGVEEEYERFVPEHIKEFFEKSGGRLRIREDALIVSNELIAEVLRLVELSG
ncbi:MAG: radical SAM family heme chaperone HemW [Aquificae bacterium]|nr:radical SAM family heme chaperone HemW [Aquificota bacterium]